jgi:hypothetical protein
MPTQVRRAAGAAFGLMRSPGSQQLGLMLH